MDENENENIDVSLVKPPRKKRVNKPKVKPESFAKEETDSDDG